MDALPTGRRRRPPSRPRRVVLALLLGVSAASGSHADPAGRFDLRASVQPRPSPHAGGGFTLDAALAPAPAPAPAPAQGGRFAVDAVATPAGGCASSSDVIFANGFDINIAQAH
jgi:hypothetical protein